jgi:transcriptional regulator with PAS, ATPase and Fis domain
MVFLLNHGGLFMSISFKVLKNEEDLLRMNVEGIDVEIKGVVAKSPRMLKALAWSVVYSATADVICLCGESGTGKEMVFRAIKQVSGKGNAICVNCGAMTETLLESELFGHKKGSFTDAVAERKGAFIEADDGFLFLDEIGEMTPRGQAKLLRAIEYKEVKPVGSDVSLKHRAKVILATNRDLVELSGDGRFRRDLYYRIEGFKIELPPLRERPEDVEALLKHFCGSTYKFSKEVLPNLLKHDWPGNVRELKNAVERAKINSLYGEKQITWDMFGISKRTFNNSNRQTLEDMEKILVEDAFTRCEFNISSTSRALGVPRSTLYSKLKKYSLIS